MTLQYNPLLTTAHICNNRALQSINIRDCAALTTLKCYSNALNTLIVEDNPALTALYCYDNQLSTLSLQGCTALNALHCYQNKISGSGMTTLVNSLPTRTASNRGHLYVMYNTDENNSSDNTPPSTADCNIDARVNISDVTALINYLLSGSWY